MAYLFHIPSAPLNVYINRFYYPNESGPLPREKILPLPALDLKINFGGGFQVYDADQDEPFTTLTESWALGLWTTYHIVDWPSDLQYLGVGFKPGGAYPFLQLPLSELQNQVVSLDAIWGTFAAEVRERLYAASTIQARFALLEQFLLARLCEAPPGLRAVQYAVAEIARHHGTLSIRELSESMGMSQKHLIAQFKQMVGCTPKELGRLHRFADILASIDLTQPVDWTLVAHQFRYHDQSHFIRDFKEFTGRTPTDYLRLRRQMHAESPDRAQILRLLPIG
ncbi:MAG TPA: AraC family transcriptional regulator [Anaerolineales bacterium]|nr:AraC family transcriptional regulator [Anaerolineales bacterium]